MVKSNQQRQETKKKKPPSGFPSADRAGDHPGNANSLDESFGVEAPPEALEVPGRGAAIFHTDQGGQFRRQAWIATAEGRAARVSMDGKGRWMDEVFIERLWRSVKHEGVYLWAHENVRELQMALGRWFDDYNPSKPHPALGYKTSGECYRPEEIPKWREAA